MTTTIEYVVRLSGCDDTTKFRVPVTDEEAATLIRFAAATQKASEYGCQPTMIIEPYDASEYDEYDSAPTLVELVRS